MRISTDGVDPTLYSLSSAFWSNSNRNDIVRAALSSAKGFRASEMVFL